MLDQLQAISRKESRIVVGMISGTSADAIDVAVCRLGGEESWGRVIAYGERPVETAIRHRVIRAGSLSPRDVAELNVMMGIAFADACVEVVRGANLAMDVVDLIGSHGQTIYHHSSVSGAIPCTLQVGDGDVIAERTGRAVISDFRARDIAAGGEGAPLTPRADQVLYARRERTDASGVRAVLNLGGIANITVLRPEPDRVLGFDTGPANSLLDRLARRLSNGALDCDRDGAIARAGQVNRTLLEQLIQEDDYLRRRPPKSTGFEVYGDAFVEHAIQLHGGADADLMATLTEFTAVSVAQAITSWIQPETSLDEIVVAGGGVNNPALIERIAALVSPTRFVRSEAFGVPAEAREAIGFAILADLALRGIACSLPSVTGARRAAVLGKLSFPRGG